MWRLIAFMLAAGFFSGGLQAAEEKAGDKAPEKAGVEFFEKHIRPVLVSKCYRCHAGEAKNIKGGLRLDTRENTRKGGDSGAAVVPGHADDSILIEALKHDGLEMPPNEKLSDDIIAKFEQWVRMGAPDPRDGKSSPVNREIDFKAAREHWAYRPVTQPKVPSVKNPSWAQNDIDRFVLAKLDEQQLAPAVDADAAVLVRRIYFDVLGLPPSPEQMDDFVAATKINRKVAVQKLVDELLASPHFGERWGRHWLDVVRFAESTGMERNHTFPHAWKYRDYVIESFNDDKPFDQFIREQVAGDQLVATGHEQRREFLVATGFLALGPKSLNERNQEQFNLDIADEQIDTTFRSFMGLTAGCARCHDHKFDPIPMTEYYGLAGIFTSTETYYGTSNTQGNRQPGKLVSLVGDEVRKISPDADVADPKKKGKPAKKTTAAGVDLSDLKQQLRDAEARLEKIEKRIGGDKAARKRAEKALAQATQQVSRLKEQIKSAKQDEPAADAPMPDADEGRDVLMAVLDQKTPVDTQVRLRGEPTDRGARVPRGFLTIGTAGSMPAVAKDQSGRLGLAEYLTQKENPLTARVAANRVWQHLFGRGIVASVDNFGVQGDPATHPELLDWLANDLTNNGWSVKHLIRTIMASRVYQQAGTANAKAQELDPENLLLWRARHRRLEVEAIRDAMLTASDEMELTPPAEGSIVASVGDVDIGRGLNPAKFATVTKKRSVYLPIVRTVVPEMLQVFDFPEPSNINGQREVTTVATQALYLMNSTFAIAQAEAFAKRVIDSKQTDEAGRVDLAYRLSLSRKPTVVERDEAAKFLTEMAASISNDAKPEAARLKAWTAVCQALFATAEFRYVE